MIIAVNFPRSKFSSLPMCGFLAQLVEHRTGIAEVTGSNPEKPWFFQASSFQLLKLENLLRWSFFTFIYNRSLNRNYFIYTSHHFTPHGTFSLMAFQGNCARGRTGHMIKPHLRCWTSMLLKQLRHVRTRYPLISLTWAYRGLKFKAYRGDVFFEFDRCPVTGFAIGLEARARLLIEK